MHYNYHQYSIYIYIYQYLWWIGEDKAHSFVLVRNNIKGNCSQWNKETVLNEAGSPEYLE